ncbi:MAG: glycosyltransferase [Candidatus Micrarchaeia archaeon]
MKETDPKIENGNLLIVTHFYATGPAQELRDYFIRKKYSFDYTELPFTYAERQKPVTTRYVSGREKYTTEGFSTPKNEFIYYLRDFFYILGKHRKKYDVAFAFDNLNAFSLITLKKLGFIKKVVFVTVDYSPIRFKNGILNSIYHWVDKYGCYNSDVLWDSAEAMVAAREKFHNIDRAKIAPVLVVDDGNDFNRKKIRAYGKIEKFRLVYMGHLRKNQGIELLIDACSDLHKWNRKVTLSILGGGELSGPLKEKVRSLGLEKSVFFSGYVKDHEKILDHLRKCYLAFALYEDERGGFSKYSAVGKPKAYLGCGLPVIITDVPEVARKIYAAGAGKIAKYDRKDIVKIAKTLITNKAEYKKMRRNAIKFASENTWDRIFSKALADTENILY